MLLLLALMALVVPAFMVRTHACPHSGARWWWWCQVAVGGGQMIKTGLASRGGWRWLDGADVLREGGSLQLLRVAVVASRWWWRRLFWMVVLGVA